MVTLSVANEKVFRILIDMGSSKDILFVSAFCQMNVVGAAMRPIKTSLYGFAEKESMLKAPSSYR